MENLTDIGNNINKYYMSYLDQLMINNNILSDSSFDEPMKYTSMNKIIKGGNNKNLSKNISIFYTFL